MIARRVAALLLSVLLGGVGGAAWQLTRTPDVPDTPSVVHVEDSPGWDCATSGNGLCDRPGRAIKRG